MLNATDQQQIDRALALVRAVLDSDAVAAYLFGSAVLDGLRPESDLDVLVVSKRRTTRAEKQRLVDGLLAASGRRTPHGMWRRIELTIVVERDIKPWCYPSSSKASRKSHCRWSIPCFFYVNDCSWNARQIKRKIYVSCSGNGRQFWIFLPDNLGETRNHQGIN